MIKHVVKLKKTLLMASTIKIAFNIDGQTMHSTLNTPIQ